MAVASKKTASVVAGAEALPEPKVETVVETVPAPVVAMPAPVAAIQENVRKAVEKSVADTRAAYAKAKSAAEEATGALESSYSTAAKGVVEFNTKTLEALRATAEANFDFVKAVINAKSVSEFVTLQSEHARKQVETISAQAKEIAALAQKIAAESVEPIKSQVAKTFKLPG
jgi:phasin